MMVMSNGRQTVPLQAALDGLETRIPASGTRGVVYIKGLAGVCLRALPPGGHGRYLEKIFNALLVVG